MSFDAERLLELLPAVYRIRDIDLAPAGEERGPLASLLAVLAEQIATVEENLEQLYDDQFIETCAPWVTPYIGDLIGYRALHGVVPRVASPRAEVANTIAFRRRKGTASMLEQLARDVTGWNARVVEFFELLATTQYMNHLRPGNHWAPDLRRPEPLQRIGSAFDPFAHTAEVRNIRSGRGRYNIPNVGIFLWRLDAFPLTRSPAVRVDDRRWRLSPLAHDFPLFNQPETEEEIVHLAEPVNVPEPLSRRFLDSHLEAFYGGSRSLALYVDGVEIPREDVLVCDLSDAGAGWAHLPPDGRFAVDPVLGRVALPADLTFPVEVAATFHYGFSAAMGGGEYERAASFAAAPTQTVVRVPDDQATIQLALDALGGDGVVEVTDSGRYEEAPQVEVAAESRIELRAANGRRPTLVLTGPLRVSGGEGSEFAVNGLLVTGERVLVPAGATNRLRLLRLVHTTLVPGHSLAPDSTPEHPDEPSLEAEIPDLEIVVDHSIVGGLRVAPEARTRIADSIVDATGPTGVAYSALDGEAAGAELDLIATTVIGKVHAVLLRFVSNSILLAELAPGDGWSAPVVASRRQEGCVRFSFLPPGSRVPRRFRCQPPEGTPPGVIAPRFTTLRYGQPAYAQLARHTPDPIRTGADDEGEMGAFHSLFQPQRESNLRIRLQEYLRVGLDAGIFYET